jgi:hypothetical protein
MNDILAKLDKLEQQNKDLMVEIRQLKDKIN